MNERTYKYWFFYIKPEFVDDVVSFQYSTNLYAYTDSKLYAESFMNMRNMDKFVLKKRKITRGDVNYFATNFPDGYLSEEKLPTRPKGKVINVVMTKSERTDLENNINHIMYCKLWKYTVVNPNIFKKKYKKSLNIFGYSLGYEMISKNNIQTDLSDIFSVINVDYLGAFIHLNIKTLRGGK